MSLSLRRALAAAAATATVLALAGCGGDDTKGEKASDPVASSSATGDGGEEAGGSGPSVEVGQELSGPEFAAVLKTALDQATTAHITMELGKGTGTGEGDADYTTTPPELAMTLSMAALGGEVEVRLVDGTMYMKSPSFGDKWVSFPLDDPKSPMASLGGELDMTKQFETFAAAVTSATFTGPEDVDGESLDHYTATVDSAKLTDSMPSAPGADLPDTMTQDWWFDSDGRIRKFSTDFGVTSTVLTLSDWGADVSIEAPPSDEVTSMPGMAG